MPKKKNWIRTAKVIARWLLILLSLGALLTYGLFSVSGFMGLVVVVLALPVEPVRKLWKGILPPDSPRLAKTAILTAAFLLVLAAAPDTPAIRSIPQDEPRLLPTQTAVPAPTATAPTESGPENTAAPAASEAVASVSQNDMVYVSGSGKGSKYHRDPSCSNIQDPVELTVADAEAQGYTPCKRCCE